MPEDSVIDKTVFDALLASVDGDSAFLGDLIDTYLADARDLFAQMMGSYGAGDLEAFRRAAHSLKSNSAGFGATSLAQQARELENMARAGSIAGAAPKVAVAEATFQAVSAELSRLRAAV